MTLPYESRRVAFPWLEEELPPEFEKVPVWNIQGLCTWMDRANAELPCGLVWGSPSMDYDRDYHFNYDFGVV